MTPKIVVTCVALVGLASEVEARGKSISRVQTKQPVVAITFDDGPNKNTQALLDLFKKEKVKASFFVLGKNVEKFPQLARLILAGGHDLCNHSNTHPRLGRLNEDQVREELVGTQKIIKKATGVEARLFRAPYFDHGAATWKVLKELGLPSIGCAINTGDWRKRATVESTTGAALRAKAGDIVLFHSASDSTVKAMPGIIRGLRAKGLKLVSVSQLMALKGK